MSEKMLPNLLLCLHGGSAKVFVRSLEVSMESHVLNYLYCDIFTDKMLSDSNFTFLSLRPTFGGLCPPVRGQSHFEDLLTTYLVQTLKSSSIGHVNKYTTQYHFVLEFPESYNIK